MIGDDAVTPSESALVAGRERGAVDEELLAVLRREPLVCAVEQVAGAARPAVRELGGLRISSQHVATNNAVLIAKLKLGYVIAGTEYDEQMGLLVLLVLHLAPERRALFASRTGTVRPDVPPPGLP